MSLWTCIAYLLSLFKIRYIFMGRIITRLYYNTMLHIAFSGNSTTSTSWMNERCVSIVNISKPINPGIWLLHITILPLDDITLSSLLYADLSPEALISLLQLSRCNYLHSLDTCFWNISFTSWRIYPYVSRLLHNMLSEIGRYDDTGRKWHNVTFEGCVSSLLIPYRHRINSYFHSHWLRFRVIVEPIK